LVLAFNSLYWVPGVQRKRLQVISFQFPILGSTIKL